MKNLIKLFIIVIILALFPLFIGGEFVFSIFVFGFILVLAGFLLGNSLYKNIVLLLWNEKKDCENGEALELKIIVSNSSFGCAAWSVFNPNIPEKLIGIMETKNFFIGPLSDHVIKYNFVTKYKGIYEIKDINITFSDALGVFKWTKKFYESEFFIVRPRLKPLVGFSYKARQPFGRYLSKNNAYEDITNVKDIRKYHTGDSFKRIHWKISAHRGELFIREAEATGASDIVVYFDLFKDAYDEKELRYSQEEACAECVLAIINSAFESGTKVKLAYFSNELVYLQLKPEDGINYVAEILAGLEAVSDFSMMDLFKHEKLKTNEKSELIVVTNDISRSLSYEVNVKAILKNLKVITANIKNKNMIKLKNGENGLKVNRFYVKEKYILIGEAKLEKGKDDI